MSVTSRGFARARPRALRLAADVLRVLPRKQLSSAMGRLADLGAPTPLVRVAIRNFARAYDVDMEEAVVPDGGFSSFNAFFTRELKPGSRPVDARARSIVSPADGRVEDLGTIDAGSTFLVKGQTYDVAGLLADPQLATRFRGGAFFIVYLSPRDYHRVHAPVEGRVGQARHVGGTLLPVNQLGLQHFPGLFARNERVVTIQSSPHFGDVATIMVGAIGVGRISMSFDSSIVTNRRTVSMPVSYGANGPFLAKAAHLGTFHLGSTAVVMVGPEVRAKFVVAAGDVVRMGQAVALGDGA